MPLSEIRERYGNDGITDFVKNGRFSPGTYSDDTQMTLCIARSLIKYAHADMNTLMTDIANEFLKWSVSPENNRAPGTTCMAGCRNLAVEKRWHESGVPGKGCGSAMRAAPIGLIYHDNEQKLIEIAKNSSNAIKLTNSI